MRRLLAALVAVALIAGAVVLRNIIDSDSGDGADSGADSESLQIICGTDLLVACNELARRASGDGADLNVTAEAEQVTAQRISSGELDLSGSTVWLAAGPWPEITEAGGAPMPALAGSDVLARSPAVIVARTDRMEAIAASCTEVSWACIGDHAGGEWSDLGGEATWGRVEVGLPEPDAGDGMVTVNQAVASRVGRTDFATNDLDSGPQSAEVSAWFDRLAVESKSNATSTSPLTRFLRLPGSLGVLGALESEAIEQLSTAAAADTITVVAPEPVATADVRLWAGSEKSLTSALQRLTDGGSTRLVRSLEGSGWRVVGADGTTSVPSDDNIGGARIDSLSTALPDGDGLPSPGVTSAIDTRWENAR